MLQGGYERLAKRLPDKITVRLKAGDVLRMLTPGGGGGHAPSRRADNPALLSELPDLGVAADAVVADVEAGRASR